jgi:pantoate--beta-alanine ligase
MQLMHTVTELRSRLAAEKSVAFVPTMGNLHAGHLSLLEIAKQHGACVVVSIFVNRLQFEPGSDFDRYPRTLNEDSEKLRLAGADIVFVPDEQELYPEPQQVLVQPPKLAQLLEGEHRPGHFAGVATVVLKLLNIVRPGAAIFGKKDYQQLAIVREMVAQLNVPVQIIGAETVRAADGLALSSRNGYLSAGERHEAARLSRHLHGIKAAVEAGRRDFAILEGAATADLTAHGWRTDYIAVRERMDLAVPAIAAQKLVVLGAALLGKVRLIDNVEIDAPGGRPIL